MRRFFEAVARALRGRRELAVAAATAIIAALIAGGQATLAAIVAAGASGLVSVRSFQFLWAARDLLPQVNNVEARAARASTYRKEARAYRRHLLAVFRESRKHLDSLKGDACQRGCWYAPHLEGALERAEKRLAQAAPAELLTPEEVDARYTTLHANKGVNTAEEE